MPEAEGPPLNGALARFGQFLDRVEAYHRSVGDAVRVETRPLWQYDLGALQARATQVDRVYFPHKLRSHFPIGPNALYYKNSPLAQYVTVDAAGWGASLSFLPVPLREGSGDAALLDGLRTAIARNESVFAQPPQGPPPVAGPYSLFVCQLPHDETIRFHSGVSVEQALRAMIDYAERAGIRLLVKGHPANPRSMEPLRAIALGSPAALWVDDASIHTCLASADRVFLVNSGVGFEAMLHDRTCIRFGRAEYDAVVPLAEPNADALLALRGYAHSREDYAAFLAGYLARCIRWDDPASYARVLDGGAASAPDEAPPAFAALPVQDRRGRTETLRQSGGSDVVRWTDAVNLKAGWSARAGLVAKLIRPGDRVLDLGCGAMDLEAALPPGATYLPADLVRRDARTLFCDLNAGMLPEAEADVVAMLGVLEYCHRPADVLAAVARRWRRLVLTYNPSDLDTGRDRRAHGWFNDLPSAGLVALAAAAGYRLDAIVPHGPRERIYGFSAAAGRA